VFLTAFQVFRRYIDRVRFCSLLTILLVLVGCVPVTSESSYSNAQVNYLDSKINMPATFRKVEKTPCREDIELFTKDPVVDIRFFDRGDFCFRFSGKRDDAMSILNEVLQEAGYEKTTGGVSPKGLGLEQWLVKDDGQTVKLLGVAYRPDEPDDVYITVSYLGNVDYSN
jgi:hypothetical protein